MSGMDRKRKVAFDFSTSAAKKPKLSGLNVEMDRPQKEPVSSDTGGNCDGDEGQEMDRLIRSACPDNLEGLKCKQRRCEGLRICPDFNRPNKADCYLAHDHQAARIAVWLQRRAQADQNEARKGPGKNEKRRLWRQRERTKAQRERAEAQLP
ncbi:MAG: hypothetical protein Q9168_003083 [Polycauliona sp. 1 TL-2023]